MFISYLVHPNVNLWTFQSHHLEVKSLYSHLRVQENEM